MHATAHTAAIPAAMRVLCEKFGFTTYRPLSNMARTVNHPFPHQRGTEHLGPMRMAPFGDAASIDAAKTLLPREREQRQGALGSYACFGSSSKKRLIVGDDIIGLRRPPPPR